MNNAYQASKQDMPFYLNYGKHPRLPNNPTLLHDRTPDLLHFVPSFFLKEQSMPLQPLVLVRVRPPSARGFIIVAFAAFCLDAQVLSEC